MLRNYDKNMLPTFSHGTLLMRVGYGIMSLSLGNFQKLLKTLGITLVLFVTFEN